MRARRTTITIGFLAASSLALAACSGSDPAPAASTSTPSSAVTVTETVTETATPTASASATSSTSAGPQCGTSDVKAAVTPAQAGAGQRQAFVVLTNTSGATCSITGYAGLQLQTASGANVPTKVVRVASPAPKTVKVKPGGSASSTITFGVVPSGTEPQDGPCEPEASKLKVIPPNATTSVTAAWTLGPVCNKGKISANAFVAGNGS